MSKTRGSKSEEEETPIVKNKKTFRSTTCYDLLRGENRCTKTKLACDTYEKLLDPTNISRKSANKTKQCRQPWHDKFSDHRNLT